MKLEAVKVLLKCEEQFFLNVKKKKKNNSSSPLNKGVIVFKKVNVLNMLFWISMFFKLWMKFADRTKNNKNKMESLSNSIHKISIDQVESDNEQYEEIPSINLIQFGTKSESKMIKLSNFGMKSKKILSYDEILPNKPQNN